jgi:hypothetical protein
MRARLYAIAAVAALGGCDDPPGASPRTTAPPPAAPLTAEVARATATASAADPPSPLAKTLVPSPADAARFDLPAGDEAVTAERVAALFGASNAPAKVVLLEPGGTPRRVLAHTPGAAKDATAIAIAITLASATHQELLARRPVPPLVAWLEAEAATGTPWRQPLVLTKVSLGQGDDAKALAGEIEPFLGTLANKRSHLGLEAGGRTTSRPELETPLTPEAQELWTTVAEAVSDMVPHLPAAAVGVGARWRVHERLERAGVGMLRSTIYRLVARSDAGTVLEGELRELPLAEPVSGPAPVEGLVLRAERGYSRGQQRIELSPAGVIPRRMSCELASRLALVAEHKASRELVPTRVELEQRFESGPRSGDTGREPRGNP